MTEPYNPLDTRNLGASVAEALLETDPQPLGDLQRFEGAGLYAIYYDGAFIPYAPIASANRKGQWRWPIYVGKAVPAGARKALTGPTRGTPLFGRLREHADSVRAAQNLELTDFRCRFLVVEDIWIPLGESLLIAKFAPLWNRTVDGFGNHDPGKGRLAGMRSRWDTLHPGRPWVQRTQPRSETPEIIIAEVEDRLRAAPPPPARPKLLAESDVEIFEEREEESRT